MANIKRANTSGITKSGVAIPDVPDAPTIGASADVGTSRAFNNGSATVAFTAAATGGTPTSYTATSTPGSFTASGAGSPLTVTGLQSATSYTFAVTATNATATGPASSASSSITATTVPATPSAPTATNSGSGRAYNNGSASVAFTAPATGGSAISSYTVTSSPGSYTGTGSSSPITVTGLQSNTAYTYTVTATNANGTSSASSASASVTATTVPQAPTIGTATSPSSATASVTFTAGATGGSAITGYTVTSSPGGITGTGAASPITVSGLTNGTAYTFTVTATNANGTSAASSASNSVTPQSIYWIEYFSNPTANILYGTNYTGANVAFDSSNNPIVFGYSSPGEYIIADKTTGAVSSNKIWSKTGSGTVSILSADYDAINGKFVFAGNYRDSGTVTNNTPYFSTFNTSGTFANDTGGGAATAFRCYGIKIAPTTSSTANIGYSNDGSNNYPTISTWLHSGSFAGTQKYLTDYAGHVHYGVATDGSKFYVVGSSPALTAYTYSGNCSWTKTVSSNTFYQKVAANSSYVTAIGNDTTSTGHLSILTFNTSGTLQWQAKVTNPAGGFSASYYSIAYDSSNNVYVNAYDGSTAILLKYNSSGTLQWQRKITASGGSTIIAIRFLAMGWNGTDLFLNAGPSINALLRYPTDGSVTGSTSFFGGTLTIAAGDYTSVAGTQTVSDGTTGQSSVSQPVAGVGASLSTYTYTVGEKAGL